MHTSLLQVEEHARQLKRSFHFFHTSFNEEETAADSSRRKNDFVRDQHEHAHTIIPACDRYGQQSKCPSDHRHMHPHVTDICTPTSSHRHYSYAYTRTCMHTHFL